jgi:hypothetical protein
MKSDAIGLKHVLYNTYGCSRWVHMQDSKPMVPGGAVTDEVARVIRDHPSVIGQRTDCFRTTDRLSGFGASRKHQEWLRRGKA